MEGAAAGCSPENFFGSDGGAALAEPTLAQEAAAAAQGFEGAVCTDLGAEKGVKGKNPEGFFRATVFAESRLLAEAAGGCEGAADDAVWTGATGVSG